MDNSWKNKFIVAAIDFGTTFSGFALSFLSDYKENKTNILTYHWQPGDQPITHKTPTCLLLNPDKTFHSFGYDAEEKYAELAEDNEHKQWHYFQRFKMKLYNSAKTNNCGLSFQSTIKDIEGRDIEAMTVFSHSVAYMKRKIIEVVREKSPVVREDDIHYVLTTPAIWSEQAKLFMRKAARNVVGVPDKRLGEQICAWVELKDGETATVDEIRQFYKEKIAKFKVPKYVKFVKYFPLTVTGKVQKFKIREEATKSLGLEHVLR